MSTLNLPQVSVTSFFDVMGLGLSLVLLDTQLLIIGFQRK